jgi:hypothetical protein
MNAICSIMVGVVGIAVIAASLLAKLNTTQSLLSPGGRNR